MNLITSLSIGTLLIIPFIMNAQDKTVPPGAVKQETSLLSKPPKQLNLTYEQQTPHREIIKRYAEMTREVRKSALKPQEKKTKLIEIDLQREAELKVLLTPEQYTTHLELKENRKAQRVDMRKTDNPGPTVKAK